MGAAAVPVRRRTTEGEYGEYIQRSGTVPPVLAPTLSPSPTRSHTPRQANHPLTCVLRGTHHRASPPAHCALASPCTRACAARLHLHSQPPPLPLLPLPRSPLYGVLHQGHVRCVRPHSHAHQGQPGGTQLGQQAQGWGKGSFKKGPEGVCVKGVAKGRDAGLCVAAWARAVVGAAAGLGVRGAGCGTKDRKGVRVGRWSVCRSVGYRGRCGSRPRAGEERCKGSSKVRVGGAAHQGHGARSVVLPVNPSALPSRHATVSSLAYPRTTANRPPAAATSACHTGSEGTGMAQHSCQRLLARVLPTPTQVCMSG